MAVELNKTGDEAPSEVKISIHMHGAGNESAETMTVDASEPIAVFIAGYRDAQGRPVLAISLVEEEADLDPGRTWHDHGIRHGHRVHGHRCRLVAVTVDYAGRTIEREFRANKRVARIKDWAVGEFKIPLLDAADLVLAYGHPLQPVNPDLHVGDLKVTDCKVDLQLVRADYFNG